MIQRGKASPKKEEKRIRLRLSKSSGVAIHGKGPKNRVLQALKWGMHPIYYSHHYGIGSEGKRGK
jgi:hypothetical protein